jgi:hypothetical protein
VYNLLLVLHFVGLALLLGAVLVQLRDKEKTVTSWMLDGALTMVLTGFLMVGIVSSKALDDGEGPNNPIVAFKLIVVLVIAVLAFLGKRKPAPQAGLWAAIGVLTLLNIVVAVFGGVLVATA